MVVAYEATDEVPGSDLCKNATDNIEYVDFLGLGHQYGGIPDLIIFEVLGCTLLSLILSPAWWIIRGLATRSCWRFLRQAFWTRIRWFRKLLSQEYWLDPTTTFNPLWFKLDLDWLESTYGEEGMLYLSFQRYLLLLLLLFNMFTLITILPINIISGTHHESKAYKSSTLGNMSANDDILWVHMTLGWLYLPLACLVIKQYCKHYLSFFVERTNRVCSTLVITQLPPSLRHPEALRDWFGDKYPFCEVERLYFCYHTQKLHDLHEELSILKDTLALFKQNPSFLHDSGLLSRQSPVELEEYYLRRVSQLETQMERETRQSFDHPVDQVFVKLSSAQWSQFILECENLPKLRDQRMKIALAPKVEEIEWQNIVSSKVTRVRGLAVYITLSILILFFTSPQAVYSQIHRLHMSINNEIIHPDTNPFSKQIVLNYLPLIVRISVTALITKIVNYSVKFVGYWKQVQINLEVLRFNTIYLLLVVLILPILGFITVEAVIVFATEWFEQGLSIEGQPQLSRWRCVFLPEGGLFFVHYVISSALLSDLIEFEEVVDMFYALCDLIMAKSWVEASVRDSRRKSYVWFGDYYSYELFMYVMVVGLSTSTPMILPCGWGFFLIRHLWTSVHLRRSDLILTNNSREFHYLAIDFVLGSTVALQALNAFFFVVRATPEGNLVSYASAAVAVLSILFLVVESQSEWQYPWDLIPRRGDTPECIAGGPLDEVYLPKFLAQWVERGTWDRRPTTA